MEVTVAKNSGFCRAVEKLVGMVEKLVEDGKKPVQTYGDIVHNPDVVASLESKGVGVANSIEEIIKDAYVVVRAHGVPDTEMRRLKEKTGNIHDGKCPIVGKLQNSVKEKVREGYFAVVFGKLGHPEMVCVTGDLPEGSYSIIANAGEAIESVKSKSPSLVYLCAETTKNSIDFYHIEKELGDFCQALGIELEANNTTCRPTGNAKVYARALALQSDAMVIIGGKNSENTQTLAKVCEEVYLGTGKKVIRVVNGGELEQYLKDGSFTGVEKVGVAAGTSTPPWVIDDVCSRLREYNR